MLVLKSLFFATLPYFISKLPIPCCTQQEIKRIQSILDDIVWNGKKPKIKLNLAAFPPKKGGIGMIDFESRLHTLHIHMIQMALNTQCIEFWQNHLYSLFSVPFDIAIRANLDYRHFKLLYIMFKMLLINGQLMGLRFDWLVLSSKVSKIVNGNVKNFFIHFNLRAYFLNNRVVHFADVSNLCSLCKKTKETYVHLFWECEHIKCIWHYAHLFAPIQMRTKDQSLFPTEASPKIIFVFTLAKYYIHTCCLFGNRPNIIHFKNKLWFHIKALKCLYTCMDKAAKFENILGHLHQVLNV